MNACGFADMIEVCLIKFKASKLRHVLYVTNETAFMKCIHDIFAILLTFDFDCRVLKRS